ncbi:MAG TPA: hypothetical protein VEK07_24795 [Polyangiaceae bacterium]|nr:hypothetical protein [Polyangiaceae bacterium]
MAISSLFGLGFWGTVTHADASSPPSDDEKAAARILGTEGVKLALSGDCTAAVDKLTRAEALVHAPTTAVPLAQCDIKLGKLVAGTEILNRVVHETLPSGAPKSWTDARQQAQTLLDAATPRIPKLRIHVDRPGGATSDVRVTVDGESVPIVLLDNDRPTDPGTHRVAAVAPRSPPVETEVVLTEGQTQSVSLHLQPPAPTAAAPAGSQAGATATASPGPSGPEPAAPEPPNRVPAYVLLSVGAAGVVVGTVFGVLALGAKSRLESDCHGLTCPLSSQSDISAYKTDPIVSTAGWAVGVAGIAVGTFLLVTAHSESAPPKTAHLEVRPWIAPGSAGIGGSFP